MNVIRDLVNFFRMQAGIIFASQKSDPPLPAGVVAFWHNATADKFRLQNAAGAVGDILISAPIPANTLRGAVGTDYRFEIPAGATGNVDFVLPETDEIVDVVLHKTNADGGGAGTIQLVNPVGDLPITDAMSVGVPVGSVIRPQLISNTSNLINAGGPLRFVRTRTASADESVVAYIRTLRRA
jgi:hypothetical protein